MDFLQTPKHVTAYLTDMRDTVSKNQSVSVFSSDSPEAFSENGRITPVEGNIGSCSIDAQTMTIYFTALRNDRITYYAAMHENVTHGDYDIYSGHLKRIGDSIAITSIAPLSDAVNKEFSWDAQPAVSPDGKTLYFASNRPGGKGGTDIWCSKKQSDGKWGEAFDLDSTVNTECDELTPFVTQDGEMLYFSSSGHATVGGYDIFKSHIGTNGYSEAENIGEPVNTPADELFPSTYADADSLLYYASDQPGGIGGFDMYLLKKISFKKHEIIALAPEEISMHPDIPLEQIIPKKLLPDTVRRDSVKVEGNVKDAITNKPIDSAIVTVNTPPPDNLTNSTITDSVGHFEISLPKTPQFQVIIQAPNYFYDVYNLPAPSSTDSVFHVPDVALPETLSMRIEFPFDNFNDPYKYTLTDSGVPGALTWMKEIELLAANLAAFKSKIIEISLVGNTDSSGTDDYNDRLGLRRAQFVKDQLVQRGIPAQILSVSSNGRKNPLPRKPGETEELYRARCRRTEISKIIRIE